MFFNQKKEDLYIKALKDLLRIAPDNDDAAKKVSGAAQSYEDQAREKIAKGNKRHAIQLLEKAVRIEETAERWVELAQLYEDEGEEILMDNAIKKWKQLSGEMEQAQALPEEPQVTT
jgi:predicted Zn-dependent protease